MNGLITEGFLEFRMSTGVAELPNSRSAVPAEPGQVRVQRQLRISVETGFHETSRASFRSFRWIGHRWYPRRYLQRHRQYHLQLSNSDSLIFFCFMGCFVSTFELLRWLPVSSCRIRKWERTLKSTCTVFRPIPSAKSSKREWSPLTASTPSTTKILSASVK